MNILYSVPSDPLASHRHMQYKQRTPKKTAVAMVKLKTVNIVLPVEITHTLACSDSIHTRVRACIHKVRQRAAYHCGQMAKETYGKCYCFWEERRLSCIMHKVQDAEGMQTKRRTSFNLSKVMSTHYTYDCLIWLFHWLKCNKKQKRRGRNIWSLLSVQIRGPVKEWPNLWAHYS